MTPFTKLRLGSVCLANLLTLRPVETYLVPRIQALVFVHTQSNRHILSLFVLQVGDQRQLGGRKCRLATTSRFLNLQGRENSQENPWS